ncbi:MAG: acyl-CoA synthetase FdrA [Spirochaetota bacterium]|jgi:succinyl-CoA synthetase alpha subunit|nr:acyl-CoA synthetase FdrA [Spirochaetota bacterium]
MVLQGFIKKGEYFDSVSLMIVSKEVNALPGIADSAIVMGTAQNKDIVRGANLYIKELFDAGDDTDLLIALSAESEAIVKETLVKIDEMFKALRNKKDEGGTNFTPKSLEGAIDALPGANISLISVAGRYAAREAMRALKKGLHVMLFSDNVSIEDELRLKKFARDKGLIVMGPDCGTAVIGGVPLAFANVLARGDCGIVAASGTGLQEVMTIISNEGAGISQAIGTGGRDVKEAIGGIMFIDALRALAADPATKVIVLVSKPPHESVLRKIAGEIKTIKKPVVGIFIGGDASILESAGAIAGTTLEETAVIAAAATRMGASRAAMDGEKRGAFYREIVAESKARIAERRGAIDKQAKELAAKCRGRYMRGLFSGGTLCDETQLICKDLIGFINSNAPLDPSYRLKDSFKSVGHTIIDLGEDEFTVGRPHPMIDFSLRNKKILEEAADKETAIILLDLVLGYGSNMDPLAEFVPTFKKAKEIAPDVHIICSITGTDGDPQNRARVKAELERAGAIMMPSNAAASELVGKVIRILEGK